MKLWLPLMVLISIVPSTSIAAEGQGYGLGMDTCGEFAKSYAANPKVTEGIYFAWAAGFMTGLNMMAVVDKMPWRAPRQVSYRIPVWAPTLRR